MKLDYVLALRIEDFLERRLQTCVYKLGLAKSIHHARVLIKQRHIRYGLNQSLQDLLPWLIRLFSETVSASRLSTCPLSWSAWTLRSTLTSLLPRPTVVAVLVVLPARRLVLPRVVMTRRVKKRRSKLKILEYGWVSFPRNRGFHCHCSVIYLSYDDEIRRIKKSPTCLASLMLSYFHLRRFAEHVYLNSKSP